MRDYEEHYAALGLRYGATQKEIRVAYRRLVKLYHPDKDISLDAEIRYREVRRAFKALSKLTNASPSFQRTQTTPNIVYNDRCRDFSATGEDILDRHLLNKKLKQKMSYARKVSITLFSVVSGLYVGSELNVSIIPICIIGIIGVLAGNVFWSMLWYLLNDSKKNFCDVVQDTESLDGIVLLLAGVVSIFHAATLRIVFFKQFSMMPSFVRRGARLSAPGGVTFVELFLFVLVFCGVIKIFLWEKKGFSHRDFQ